jgi:NMD protein affecting ribosome stability and mRNA decay
MKMTRKQPTTPSNTRKDRGRKRALVRRGSRSDHRGILAHRSDATVVDHTRCARCGAVYVRRRWRAPTRAEQADPDIFARGVCPACVQVASGEYHGTVLIRGRRALAGEEMLRRRIANVAARARFTQPERRIVAMERRRGVLEVLTTSQKLAHRIVQALVAAFGGRGTYSWSERDVNLRATWTWD